MFVVVVMVIAGVALAGHARGTGVRSPASGLVLRADVGIGGVRVGEGRSQVTAAVGAGRPRDIGYPDYGLGSCSGGRCRSYWVAGSILGVDFARDGRVQDVLTRAASLRVDGVPMSAGFAAVSAPLKGWRVLECDGGGRILLHSGGVGRANSQLLFTDRFYEAVVSTGPAPSGCALPSDLSTKLVSVPWVVLETGARARSLVIQYRAPQCFTGPGQATVRETASTVWVEVRQPVLARSAACTDELWIPRARVPLRAPLAGRRIQGAGLDLRTGFGNQPVSLTHPRDGFTYLLLDRKFHALLPEVPRVLGLAPDQARYVLALQGFRAHLVGNGPVVIAQYPSRGQVPRDSRASCSGFAGDVTLTTGPRHRYGMP